MGFGWVWVPARWVQVPSRVLVGFKSWLHWRFSSRILASHKGDPGSIPGQYIMLTSVLGFPFGSAGKESACNVGDLGSFPGLGRFPGWGHGNPLQYSCLENPHGQKSLAGYNPWGCKESDTTEWLSTPQVLVTAHGFESQSEFWLGLSLSTWVQVPICGKQFQQACLCHS